MKTRTLLLAIYFLSIGLLPVQAFAQIGSTKLSAREIKRQNRQNQAFMRQVRKLQQERLQNPDVIAQQQKEQAFFTKRARRDSAEAARQNATFATLDNKPLKLRGREER